MVIIEFCIENGQSVKNHIRIKLKLEFVEERKNVRVSRIPILAISMICIEKLRVSRLNSNSGMQAGS